MKLKLIILTLFLVCVPNISFSDKSVSVEDIFITAYELSDRFVDVNLEINSNEQLVIDFFKEQALLLHKKGVIKLSKEKTAYFMAGQSIVTLGAFLKEINSNKEADDYADKLIRYGRSILSGYGLTNPQSIAVAMITQCFRNL